MEILAKQLQQRTDLETITVNADEPWSDGPKQLADADGAVLYLAEGAKWLQANSERQQAFEQLAARGGGLSCLHWAMGTRDAQYVESFVKLFGGCHGGPDRKFQVLRTTLTPAGEGFAAKKAPFEIEDEFYYALKFTKDSPVTPLWQAIIDGNTETVAWTWQRADGGRSFGFSGAHFHRNWEREEYRTLVRDGILWTMSLDE
jgi:type 1 glutamine amidotransferase